ncbi:DUF885 domain-containing protein [Halioxenophilus aromaticivorans]|uniref:DUF885 domain-containing protein n=1 Tax=Halioxenophilus aromaticivorans TaxID=1306992 RepID=A0AAV3U3V9_9ALTE
MKLPNLHLLLSRSLVCAVFAFTIAFTITFTVALTACSNVQPADSGASELTMAMDDYWQHSLEQDTFVAGSSHPYITKAKLPDLSPDALAAHQAFYQALLQRAKAIANQGLSAEESTSKALLIYELNNRLDKYRFGEHLTPFTSEGGFWLNIGRLPSRLDTTIDADLAIYLKALKQSPLYIQQQIYWLEQGLAQGITHPQTAIGHTLQTISSVSQPEHYLQPLAHLDKRSEHYLAAKATINEELIPALKALHRFMAERYLPNARTSIGLNQLPNGQAWYQNRVTHFVTKPITPQEVHALGLSEMERIQQAMQVILAELKFAGSLAEFLDFLRSDPQFYATSEAQLLKEAAYYAKRADGILPSLFNTLPRRPYSVEPVPAAIAPNYTTGRYYSPPGKHSAGQYWVNTYNLPKRPLYELPALTLHEAVPGHHLQISLSQEKTDLPTFRREGYISAFGEGWALYCEYLGEEVGFYQTPYERFGRLIYESWRAARLVVDTGFHWYGWSREQAMDYMAANTGLSLHNVQTEVDRYIIWPGQALSYKMGELTIRQLREKAQQALAGDFDIKDFHDALLAKGAITLDEMAKVVEGYITQVNTNE